MSIINQMLRDLENRNPEQSEPAMQPNGIRITAKPGVNKFLWLGSLIVLFLLMAGYRFFYEEKESAAVLINKPVVQAVTSNSIAPAAPISPASPLASSIPVLPEPNEVLNGQESHLDRDKASEHYFFKMLVAQSLASAKKQQTPQQTPLLTTPLMSKATVFPGLPRTKAAAKKRLKTVQNRKILANNPVAIKQLSNQQQADFLYQQVNQANKALATTKLQQVLALYPLHLKARLLLAKILNERGLVQETAHVLDESLRLFPAQVQLTTTRAQLYLHQKNPAGALKLLQRLESKDQATETALSLIAASYQQLGAYPQAAEGYQKLVKLNPAKAQHWLGLALMQEQLGNRSFARDAYQQALAKNTLKATVVSYIKQRLIDLR